MYTEQKRQFLVENSTRFIDTKFNFDFTNHDEEFVCVCVFFVHRPTIRVDEMNYDRTVSTAGVVF